jgi:hypothetical protein
MIRHASKVRVPLDQITSSKVKLAKSYDQGDKGYLTDAELGALYGDQAPLSPVSIDNLGKALDFLEVAPGFRPLLFASQEEYNNYTAATSWRGNFQIPGIGAGHAKTGQRVDSSTTYFVINLILDLFGSDYLIDNLQDARVFIGALGTLTGAFGYFPTFVARAKVFYNVRGNHYSEIYPSQLQLALPLSMITSHAGSSGGISFYGSVVFSGTTYWINLDGVPFRNFDVSPI